MKKIIAIAAVAVCASAFAELKIGTVDMMTLVRNHKSYETNKKLLQDAEKDYQKKLDAMRADIDAIQDEGKKIADQAKNPMLAQAQKDKIEKDLIEVQNRFVGAQQKLRSEAMESQQKLQEFETRLLKVTTDDIRAMVNKYAEKNGYDIIVESTVTAFAKKSLSVTDDLLKEMGVDPKNAKGKEKDKDEGK
jgi:Skp family chaperone for outer membrane proteins